MFYIGCHLSASDGFLAMGRTALSIGANTFQFFTRNPRGSKAKAIDPADVAAFLALAAENEFGTLVAHAPYTINPCSKDEHTREFARMTLADDLKRMGHLPGRTTWLGWRMCQDSITTSIPAATPGRVWRRASARSRRR